MVTYTSNKKLNKPANGEYPDTWDVPVNQDWDIIDKALGSSVQFTVGASDITLTISDAQNQRIVLTGTPSASRYIIIPFQYLSATTAVGGMWIVDNQTNAAQYVVTEAPGTTGVSIPSGRKALVYSDGVNVAFADDARISAGTGISVSGSVVSLSVPVSAANGGTGVSSPTAGSVLVGNGSSAVSLVAPGVSGNVLTSDGSTWYSAAPTGGGGGSGITTITLSSSTGLSFTPNTLTTPGGTMTLSGTLSVSNGGTGAVTLGNGLLRGNGTGAITTAALVNLNSITATPVDVTGVLQPINGGTGNTTLNATVQTALTSAPTGSGSFVLSSSPSIATPTVTGGVIYYGGGSAYVTLNSGVFGVYSSGAICSGTTAGFSLPGTLTVSGVPYANQTNFTLISDERTKKDIRPYLKSLNDVVTLDPVTFEYNGKYGTPNDGLTRVGLIAQQVNNTPMSELVGTYVYTDPTTGQKTTLYDLNISDLMFAFINSIKALDARVKDLESKVGP